MGFKPDGGIYRTAETGDTFRTAYHVQIFGSRATFQGVSGVITQACIKELKAWAILCGITTIEYARHKNGRIRTEVRRVEDF